MYVQVRVHCCTVHMPLLVASPVLGMVPEGGSSITPLDVIVTQNSLQPACGSMQQGKGSATGRHPAKSGLSLWGGGGEGS